MNESIRLKLADILCEYRISVRQVSLENRLWDLFQEYDGTVKKELSEEVNKILPKDWIEKADKAKKEGDMYTGGFFMGMIDTVEKVLSILKH